MLSSAWNLSILVKAPRKCLTMLWFFYICRRPLKTQAMAKTSNALHLKNCPEKCSISEQYFEFDLKLNLQYPLNFPKPCTQQRHSEVKLDAV
jgi:hypothetical protein